MKKLIIAVSAMLLFSASAYAQSVELSADKPTEVTGLEGGFYDLTVTCTNDTVNENAYIYGVSDDHAMSSTVIPKSDGEITVKVKGIGVTDGRCEIGINGSTGAKIISADLSPSKEYKLITGGDMSEVSYIEGLGGVYRDADGNAVDPFEFLAENGVNMARIRLSNTTGKGTGDGNYYLPAGSQDEKDCLALSKRAKDAGMGIQFTFNYSDYWSNGTRQIIPSEWVKQIKSELGYDVKDADFLKSMTAEQKKQIQDKLCDIIYTYTKDIMTKLGAQGTLPEYVSLGNEINGGMLFPFGNAYSAKMSTTKKPLELVWGDDQDGSNDIQCDKELTYLVKFLQSGYKAVKEVSPDTQVIIHLATEGSNGAINDGKYTWLMDEFNKANIVDVLGASYYPAWSGATADKAREFSERMYKKYGKPVLFMETGYSWNPKKKNGYDGQLTANAEAYKEKYPYSQEGHAGYMAELINEMKKADGSCLGALYWDPCMIHVEDPDSPNESLSGWAVRESDDKADSNVVENTTLFDFDGKAVKSVSVFKNSRNNADRLTGEIDDSGDAVNASVKNNTLKEKKVCLFVNVYDGNGVLQNVDIDTKTVGAGESVTLSLRKPAEMYRALLWNGESLEPLVK